MKNGLDKVFFWAVRNSNGYSVSIGATREFDHSDEVLPSRKYWDLPERLGDDYSTFVHLEESFWKLV